MSERAYLDFAVMDHVRDALVAGEPAVLLDDAAQALIWATPRMAEFVGQDEQDELSDGAPAWLGEARRQIVAASRSAPVGKSTSALLRFTRDGIRQLVRAEIRTIDADDAPLTLVRFEDRTETTAEPLEDLIAQFSDSDAGAAIVDGEGNVLASNPAFEAMALEDDVMWGLADEVARETDRLVKRQVLSAHDAIVAAGIGRLSEEPRVRSLVFCILLDGEALPQGDDGGAGIDHGAMAQHFETFDTVGTPSGFPDNAADDAEIEDMVTAPTDDPLDHQTVPEDDFSQVSHDSDDAWPDVPHTAQQDTVPVAAALDNSPFEDDDRYETADEPVAAEHNPADDDAGIELASPLAADDHDANDVSDASDADIGAAALAQDDDNDFGAEVGGFVFEPSATPIRFVWKMDADNIFGEVSDAFSDTLGPSVSAIEGKSFAEVAQWLAIDTDGDIQRSLERRDTWSGKTVLWPVEGVDLRVPVDLAALPYYNRDRVFEGYRGFGIIRMADAIVDNTTFASIEAAQAPSHDNDPHDDNSDGHGAVEPTTMAADDDIADAAPADDAGRDDPFHGEPPVLDISGNEQGAQDNDGAPVVAHGLNERELRAFASIGQRLGQQEAAPSVSDDANKADEADAWTDDVSAEVQGKAADNHPDMFATDATVEPAVEDGVAAETDMDDAMAGQTSPLADVTTVDAKAHAAAGLDAEAIDALPLALLFVRDQKAVFANMSFQLMTGHDDLDAFNDAGAVDSLIEGPSSHTEIIEGEMMRRALTLVGADGHRFAARTHMQIVPFDGQSTLMFAFEPLDQDRSETTPYVPDDATGDGAEFFDDAVSPAAVSMGNNVVAIRPLAAVDDRDDSHDAGALEVAAERALQSHIEELESIIDIASDGVVIVKPDGTIRSINGPASALFGYDRDDVVGKSFAMLFAHESQKASMDYLEGLTHNGVASILNEGREVLGREHNGGFLPLFMTMAKLPSQQAYCAVMRDITPWKQSEQLLIGARKEAEEASASKSEFLAKISHEIRTPLNAIIGFSELILGERFGALGNPRYKDYLGDINRSGRHVLELVNDLLDLSKIEAGKQDLDFTEVTVNELADDAISMIQPQAARGRVLLRSSLAPRLPKVVADMRSIRQIILNLLSNSVRFTHPGGLIVVGTSYEPGTGVVLRIKDTGIGMTTKEIELAMQPFQQVAENGGRENGGTGLGLPLTKALVEANRAEFSIHSEPGKGTIVEVLFPENRVIHA